MSHMNYILRKLTQHTAKGTCVFWSLSKWNGARFLHVEKSPVISTADSRFVSTAICSRYRFRSWHLQGFPRCPQISAPMLSGWWFLTNPFETYAQVKLESFPKFQGEKNIIGLSCHHPVVLYCFLKFVSTFWGYPENPDVYVFQDDSRSKTLQAMRPHGHSLHISSSSWHVSHCIVMHRPCSSSRNFAWEMTISLLVQT